ATARHLADVLAEIANGNATIEGDLALVGELLARDHPEKRSFAGPVWADQADLFALLEGCGGFDEEDLVADLLADVIETDHWGLKGGNRFGRCLGHLARQWKRFRTARPKQISAHL